MKIFRVLIACFVVGCCFYIKLLSDNESVSDYEEKGDGSLQVYFINLDKATDKLAHIQPQLEALGYPFTRIAGVYGKDLKDDYKKSITNPGKYKRLMHSEIGVGTIGCYLSHVNVWREFLASNHSYALVFEDDVEFEPNKLKTLVGLLLGNSQEWDFVDIDVNRHGFARTDMKLSHTFKLVTFRARVANASCYLINRKAAIEFVKKAFPIFLPVDHYMMRPWEFGIKTRGVTPQIVHQTFGESDIAKQESKSNVNLFYKVTSLFYQITADIMTCISAYWNVKV